jgi:hypothetical protein
MEKSGSDNMESLMCREVRVLYTELLYIEKSGSDNSGFTMCREVGDVRL